MLNMRFIGYAVLLMAVYAAANKEQPPMNLASKAMFNVRELVRNTDPMEIVKNMTHDASQSKNNKMAIALFKNLTNPNNMKSYMKLVKESKISKKGDIMKLTVKFMNPENLTPEGAIKTFKALDTLTVSELSGINLQYFKMIAPQVIGHSYDKLYKYINENDVKELTRIFFEIFKETETENLLWVLERIKEDGKNVEKTAELLIRGKGETIVDDWQKTSDKNLKDKVKDVVSNIQKVSNFEKASPKIPELVEAFKKATVHFLAAVISDIKTGIADIDSKDLMGKATSAIKEFSKTFASLLSVLDFDELGTDTEKALNYFHKLDRQSAKDALGDLVKMIPPIDKIMEQLEVLDTSSFIKLDKVKIAEMLNQVNKTKLPEPMVNIGIDSFLLAVKHVDPKKTRALVEFIVKEMSIDNEVYKATRSVLLNIFLDYIKKCPHLSLSGSTFDDVKGKIIKGVESVDGKLVENAAEEVTADLKRLNVTLVADVVAGANSVLKDVVSNEIIQKIFTDPKSLLQTGDRKTFTDTIYFGLDSLKLINETQFSKRCNDLANLAGDELKTKLNGVSDWVDNQFNRVQNGPQAAKQLKIDEILDFATSVLTTIDLKSTCADINSILKLNRIFSNEARAEIADIMWKAFQGVQKSVKSDSIDKEALEKIQDILETLLRALIESKAYKPDDFRIASVRLAVRSVKEFGKRKGFKPPKSESEEVADQIEEKPLEDPIIEVIEVTTEAKHIVPKARPEVVKTTTVKINPTTETPKPRSKVVFTRRPSKTTTPKPEAVIEVPEGSDEDSQIETSQITRSITENGECSRDTEDLVQSLLSEEQSEDNLWAVRS